MAVNANSPNPKGTGSVSLDLEGACSVSLDPEGVGSVMPDLEDACCLTRPLGHGLRHI